MEAGDVGCAVADNQVAQLSLESLQDLGEGLALGDIAYNMVYVVDGGSLLQVY